MIPVLSSCQALCTLWQMCRLLQWDDSAQVLAACASFACNVHDVARPALLAFAIHTIQVQLLKIYVARELGRDVGWVEEQLNVLRAVLPDMVGQVHRMKASLLLGLVRDTQVNIDLLCACTKAQLQRFAGGKAFCMSTAASKHPPSSAMHVPACNGMNGFLQDIADKMVGLKALLPGVDASRLVHRCPSLVLFHDTAKLEANLQQLRCGLLHQ